MNIFPSLEGVPFPDINEIEVNSKGVHKLLRELDGKKASEPDGISARFLKTIESDMAPILSILYKKSFQEGEVPGAWKKANAIAVYNKGSR